MKKVDLRSDTITLPTKEMLDAISNAELGDDVFQEDPTVNLLEELAATKFNKEAALFVPSGTMANLIAVLTHCHRGDEVILGDQSHTFLYEAGGISAFGGIHSRQIPNQQDGTLLIEDIKNSIRKEDVHFPPTRLICLENTHNRCFGMPLSVSYSNSVAKIASDCSLFIHVDGARIFNAAAALSVSVAKLTEQIDSVSFCLSKGLSAPAGSILCGTKDFIYRARRNRKALGGGMRQAGVLAASGIDALNTMINRIIEDHENARALAERLSGVEGITIDLNRVKTNIVYFSLDHKKVDSVLLLKKMTEKNIHFFELGPSWFRLVTHAGVSMDDVNYVVGEFEHILS